MPTVDVQACLARRIELLSGVTPVHRLPAVTSAIGSEVFVKRDDACSPVYGGTKTRKLEFILKEVQEADARSIVTLGSWASHHVLATGLHAQAMGIVVHAVVSPQPSAAVIAPALHQCLRAGVVLHPVGGGLGSAWGVWKLLRQLRKMQQRPYLVNLGGSSGPGMLGTVRAAFELVTQQDKGDAPREGPIYVALGSGSTAAGLSLGLVMAGVPRTIHAVQVSSGMVVNRFVLGRLMHAGAALLVAPHLRRALVQSALQRIVLDQSQLGQGYGMTTPAAKAAMRLAESDNLALDEIYTAKAFSAMLAASHGDKPVLYWHTLAQNLPQPQGELTLPQWYRDASWT